jgi:hypothetical protein
MLCDLPNVTIEEDRDSTTLRRLDPNLDIVQVVLSGKLHNTYIIIMNLKDVDV